MELGVVEAERDIVRLRGLESQWLDQASQDLSQDNFIQLLRNLETIESGITCTVTNKHVQKLKHADTNRELPLDQLKPEVMRRVDRSEGKQAQKKKSRLAYKKRKQIHKKEWLANRLKQIEESYMVINFSNIEIPPDAILFLAKGVGFVPTRRTDTDKLKYDVRELVRNISWRSHHNKLNDGSLNQQDIENYPNDDVPKSLYIKRLGWPQVLTPGIEELNTELKILVDGLDIKTPTSNLTKAEQRGQHWCQSMLRLQKLVFTKADKGGTGQCLNTEP